MALDFLGGSMVVEQFGLVQGENCKVNPLWDREPSAVGEKMSNTAELVKWSSVKLFSSH